MSYILSFASAKSFISVYISNRMQRCRGYERAAKGDTYTLGLSVSDWAVKKVVSRVCLTLVLIRSI